MINENLGLWYQATIENEAEYLSELNALATPEGLPGINTEIVNEIYLSTLATDFEELSVEHKQTLEAIIYQCPYAGGSAVYQARAIYSMIDDNIDFKDDSLCIVQGYFRKSIKQTSIASAHDIVVSPNPAYDKAIISSKDGSKIRSIQIKNNLGEMVISKSILTASNNILVDVSALKSGYYHIFTIFEDQTCASSKLVVFK